MYRRYLFIALLACCASCTHYYYAPNTVQTPFLQNQYDTRGSLALITGDQFSGLEATAVFSPVRYTAVLFNHFHVQHGGQQSPSNDSDWGKGRLTEFGLGLYYPAGDLLSLSLFGGWGGGRVLNSYDQGALADLYFQRTFIQPAIAIQGKWARVGIGFRLGRLEYVRGQIDYAIGEPHVTTITRIENASPIFIPETTITFGFGTRPFWINFSGNSLQLSRREDFSFARSTFAMNLTLELDYFWEEPD